MGGVLGMFVGVKDVSVSLWGDSVFQLNESKPWRKLNVFE